MTHPQAARLDRHLLTPQRNPDPTQVFVDPAGRRRTAVRAASVGLACVVSGLAIVIAATVLDPVDRTPPSWPDTVETAP
ncbi:hypothetical protein F0L68_03140 [Solihabitans fulvus]|uniref:Uncharacterized protein n=1 Tax=Solihabitans fulvus TaxID=1892852 RepID=A0A5B2XQC1_9PSEU|nr:hypothetical protein [Solihabitans fulvus]KAA2266128.1 hypothetical protein F0L68_03140 [Solihabitans fulvus]